MYYNIIVITRLLISDIFMKGKCSRIKLKKNNEVTKQFSVRIPIFVIFFTLMKNMVSRLNWIVSI